ncbi:MAG TPA: retroviral-like aspartic protease family protein [Caulobacteraceae bacterium]|jgi:predicted aspartyl protease|nr:retroviral-like aspartic protease family protein [Caulobacteraceae bacterium]
MTRTGPVVAFGLCLAVSGVAHAARAEHTPPTAPCQLHEVGELPIEIVAGQLVVDGSINDQTVRMVVDTGSPGTLLSRPAAEALGLPIRKVEGLKFYGVGGEDSGERAHIKEFKVGALEASDFDMAVSGGRDMGGTQGLLGAKFLLQADVEFDVPEGKLRFFMPDTCQSDQVVYWRQPYAVAPMIGTDSDEIRVTVLLNGRPIEAQMDTGSSLSVLTRKGADDVGVRTSEANKSGVMRMQGIGPRLVPVSSHVFPSFSFGDETIRNARIPIADLFVDSTVSEMGSHIGRSAVDQPQMLLGADFFRSHRVYVSRGQRKVYVSYEGGPVFAADAASAAKSN